MEKNKATPEDEFYSAADDGKGSGLSFRTIISRENRIPENVVIGQWIDELGTPYNNIKSFGYFGVDDGHG